MSWKYQVQVVNDENWYDNAVRFATKEEADWAADQKWSAWTQCRATRTVESDDPVTYQVVDGRITYVGGSSE